ncbi:MAG: hypothetical protein VKJ09_03620 [Leptolyngbya sp.]|nr:hypothetical protein [Leptolyngbya sp.]
MTLDLLKRAEKGSALTAAEHDANFTAIETDVNANAATLAAHVAAANPHPVYPLASTLGTAAYADVADLDTLVADAEAARDAAIVSSNTYVDEPTGRAAVADGAVFKVQGSGSIAVYEYRRVNSTTSTLIAVYPSTAFVQQFAKDSLVGAHFENYGSNTPVTTVNITDAATITKTVTYAVDGMTIAQTVGSRAAVHSTPFVAGGERLRLIHTAYINSLTSVCEVGLAFGSGTALIGYTYASNGRLIKYAGATPTGLPAGIIYNGTTSWLAGATITMTVDLASDGTVVITVSDGTLTISVADTGVPMAAVGLMQRGVISVKHSSVFEGIGGLVSRRLAEVRESVTSAIRGRDLQALQGFLSLMQRKTPSGAPTATPYSTRVYPGTAARTFFTDVQLKQPVPESTIGNVTAYVDPVSGLDTNPGTAAAPYKSLSKAVGIIAATLTVKAKPGLYDSALCWNGVSPSAKVIQVLPWGDGAIVSSMHHAGLTWTLSSGSMYTATITTVSRVYDTTNLGPDGDYLPLALVASSAVCESTPNSYFVSGTAIYVNTFDGRAPAGDTVRVYKNSNNCFINIAAQANSGTVAYLENVHFEGGALAFYLRIANAAWSGTVLAKSCHFKYSGANGTDLSGAWTGVFQECVAASNSSDGFNHHAIFGSTSAALVEIDCVARWNGQSTSGTNNGSSMHDLGTFCLRVGGDYHHNQDRNIHDINGSISWNIGVTSRDSQTNDANFCSGLSGDASPASMWLDTCTSSGSAVDLETAAGGTIYTYDLVSGGVNAGGSTVVAYTA